jgi:hypothetical protein
MDMFYRIVPPKFREALEHVDCACLERPIKRFDHAVGAVLNGLELERPRAYEVEKAVGAAVVVKPLRESRTCDGLAKG